MQNNKNYDPWADLVIAMLSTGGYRLEKSFKHIDGLRDCGLMSPLQLSLLNHKSIAQKLVASGYNRGPVLTEIFSDRLFSLRSLAENFEKNTKILSDGSREEIEILLKNIKGVGPFVIDSFLLLRGK